MTNAEKHIEKLLSWYKEAVTEDGVCYLTRDDKNTLAYAIKCCKHFEDIKKDIDSWALREEPSSSENPNKSENPTSSTTKKCTTCEYREIDGKTHEMCKSCVCGNRYKQESCDDCVSRKAVLEMAKSYNTDGWDMYTPLVVDVEDIEELPPVIPIRPKGHWIKTELPSRDAHECSECGNLAISDEWGDETLTDFCPNCGAKMEEVEV